MIFFNFNTENSNSTTAGLIGKILSDFTLLLTKMDVLSGYMSNIINTESTEQAIQITNKFFDENPSIEHLREQFLADVKYFKSSMVDLEKQKEASNSNTSDELPTKKATDDDYIRIIKHLINTNNSTTNLDIKNALRTEGFYATQEDVSKSLNFIHEQYPDFLDMNYQNIGGKTVKVWTTGSNYNLNNTSNILQSVDDTNPLSWVVSHKNDRHNTEMLDGNMTRDQARSQFAKKHGYNRDFVRAIRYKNFIKNYLKTT